jgi:hypothetical protein
VEPPEAPDGGVERVHAAVGGGGERGFHALVSPGPVQPPRDLCVGELGMAGLARVCSAARKTEDD